MHLATVPWVSCNFLIHCLLCVSLWLSSTGNQAVLCEVASLGAISEGIFSHLYIITLYLNAPYFSDPLLGDLERWDKQSLIDCWRHNAFLDLLGLIPEALPSTCPASMDEGRELTAWGGKEHKHGTHGTRASCVSLTLSLGSLCLWFNTWAGSSSPGALSWSMGSACPMGRRSSWILVDDPTLCPALPTKPGNRGSQQNLLCWENAMVHNHLSSEVTDRRPTCPFNRGSSCGPPSHKTMTRLEHLSGWLQRVSKTPLASQVPAPDPQLLLKDEAWEPLVSGPSHQRMLSWGQLWVPVSLCHTFLVLQGPHCSLGQSRGHTKVIDF